MEPKVSVIMPVYNAGEYLHEAVDSVLAQTFAGFELLLIDDAATDGSGAVCDEYAAKDPRVRVKHGRNGGICASRNAGLRMARGEWLAFCDHDDRMAPAALETALKAVEGADHKLVKFNHTTYQRFGNGAVRLESAGLARETTEWTLDRVLCVREYNFHRMLTSTVWDGLYRRDAVEAHGLRFDEGFKHGGEDIDFMLRLAAAVRGGLWLGDSLYRHYVNVGTSTSAKSHVELLDDYLRTAKMEQGLFPVFKTDAGLRFASFGEWLVRVVVFVFDAVDCPLTMAERVGWMRRYYKELVGVERLSTAELPSKRRFLYRCMRFKAERLYLRMKRLVVFLRRLRTRFRG